MPSFRFVLIMNIVVYLHCFVCCGPALVPTRWLPQRRRARAFGQSWHSRWDSRLFSCQGAVERSFHLFGSEEGSKSTLDERVFSFHLPTAHFCPKNETPKMKNFFLRQKAKPPGNPEALIIQLVTLESRGKQACKPAGIVRYEKLAGNLRLCIRSDRHSVHPHQM